MSDEIIVAGGGNLEIGRPYRCAHSRKGNFVMRVDEINGEWITGVVLEGEAKAIMQYNVKQEGDPITVRAGHSHFTPV